ncbi:hypothetical protein [Streptomyces scabiei]|uniref:hypothetical protein n=1 Tax=Streptomyces scabiei TaxID=1930 RepID=UPI0029BCCA9B|nr:hypothetical protein [Streptomyces scabiei]MDX3027480.1 hypothetical protein [Streptomyces scabiei]
MTARAAVHVYVVSKDGTKRQWLKPGDEVPSWARMDSRNLQQAETSQQSSAGSASEPARSGKGSGLEVWRSFAERNGVGVDSDMSRDDIIAACERAGVVSTEG